MILITGGAGFIGCNISYQLLLQGYDIIIVDNLINSNINNIQKIETITNKKIKFYEGDLINIDLIYKIFNENEINCVIHLAGLKSVAESCVKPLLYYNNNLCIIINLLKVMVEFNVRKIIFSSSATVYGGGISPYNEESQVGINITNPYGKTKYFQEEILKDLFKSDNNWCIVILRYFNPIGKYENGSNNIMPIIMSVIKGNKEYLTIYGNDYNTKDGTCLRDYIHVEDLAKGHIICVEKIKNNGLYIYNLGTGNPISVTDLVNTFEKVNNVKINKVYGERRKGDTDIIYADCSKIKNELGWQTTKNIDQMCYDVFNN
ncbi:GDP-mannose 4,6 dehydratase [Hokovirus HKV1]|uniref:UDP-glucose 4-epimerase n=1 Tax=Hokovirus HKV1 TaxID=1977638 RepID=A0A1V0SG19_9VIRU|nr:GDP-mannose 4,6 dehydratase [Hokovirus HKV1]